MMEAKDEVMSEPQIEVVLEKYGLFVVNTYPLEVYELLLAQAEISFPLGEVSVAKAVLAIIENPKQVNYRLKEITEYCETKVDTTTSSVV